MEIIKTTEVIHMFAGSLFRRTITSNFSLNRIVLKCLYSDVYITIYSINKNIIMSSFKSSGNIQKKESGPYRGFTY